MNRSDPSKRRSGLINLAEMPEPRESRVRKSLRGSLIDSTWPELVAAEPRLIELMREVRLVRGVDYTSCPETRWYGWDNDARGLKWKLSQFVGNGDSQPFYAAYTALFNSFRPCRHCLERDLIEADLEADLANGLGIRGIACKRQVRTEAGVIDVLTDTAVYELKLWLTRAEMFRAVGQVVLYAASVGGDRKKIIVGQETAETPAMVPILERAGIAVEVW